MFENLSERLQNVVSNIKSRGVINEDNISDMMREIRLCLLEADVNVQIVREFTNKVKEKALNLGTCLLRYLKMNLLIY